MIPFVDLRAEYAAYRAEIDTAVSRTLSSGWYILGAEVAAFEAEFAAYCGVSHAVGVASGTDALLLGLRALGVGPGDEVITVALTAVATITAIELAGAKPVLVDIEPTTYTIDPEQVETAVTPHTKAIIPVHIYGQPADMEAVLEIATRHGLAVLEDCAQAHGATVNGQRVGSLGDAAAFSFYPTKNLGAFGDGGAVVTKRDDVDKRLRLLRQYGWRERYISDVAGYNSRLDELQAAILRVRLAHLEEDNGRRRQLVVRYSNGLAYLPLQLPQVRPHTDHVFHLYVVQCERRDELAAFLKERGIGTAVHYPVPVHLQPAYRHLGYAPGSLPLTEKVAGRILSLPLYAHMPEEFVDEVVTAVITCAS
jgi:dTDP-4-amino-4,6-dideoxygalactose transaminase